MPHWTLFLQLTSSGTWGNCMQMPTTAMVILPENMSCLQHICGLHYFGNKYDLQVTWLQSSFKGQSNMYNEKWLCWQACSMQISRLYDFTLASENSTYCCAAVECRTFVGEWQGPLDLKCPQTDCLHRRPFRDAVSALRHAEKHNHTASIFK